VRVLRIDIIRERLLPGLLLFTALAVGACAGASQPGPILEIEDAWARPAMVRATGEETGTEGEEAHSASGVTSAAYFTIDNRGGEFDRLIAARTEVADVVELHLSSIEDGVMRMRQVEAIEVPAGGQVHLEPGGYHLMLIGLREDLEIGDLITITLEFEVAGEELIEVEVKSQGGQ